MYWWNFALDLGVALLLGMAIGLERQWTQHPAGLRTNTLVAVGAASFVGISRLFAPNPQPMQLASQVIAGVGFLGTGALIKEGLNVRGLNTAATIWCSGAVGALAGMGYLLEAGFATLAVLFIHIALRPVVRWMESRWHLGTDVEVYYHIQITCQPSAEAEVRAAILRDLGSQPRLSLHGLTMQCDGKADGTTLTADIYAAQRNDPLIEEVVARIGAAPQVSAASWKVMH